MEAAPVGTQLNLSWLTLIVIALISGLTLALLLTRRLPDAARIMLSLLLTGTVLLLVLGFYVATASYAPRQLIPEAVQVAKFETAPRKVEVSASAETGVTIVRSPETARAFAESPLEADGTAPKTSSAAAFPEWIRQTPTIPARGDGTRTVVVKSGPWASVTEAELHAYDAATSVAAAEFRHLDPRGVGPRLDVHRGEIRQTAVKQRFDEVTETNFGKFTAPMHQVWLQVELSPQLGERLAEPWRQAAVESRMRLLAGGGIWLTAVAGLMAFALRLDAARNGQQRTAVCVVTVVLAVGGLLFVA